MTLIAPIIPVGLAAAEVCGNNSAVLVHDDEMRLLGKVCDRRRHDFTAGRSCASRALAELGLLSTPVLAGGRGEPLWPSGVSGSIAHCAGYCVAVAGRQADFESVGVDAEQHAPLPSGVLPMVAGKDEQCALSCLPAGGVCWDRLLFSAKEAIYKCWYPLAGKWLGFEDVFVRIRPETGEFTGWVRLSYLVEGRAPCVFNGRFLTTKDFIFTLVTIPSHR